MSRTRTTLWSSMTPSQPFLVVVLVVVAGGYAPVGTAALWLLGLLGVHGAQFPCYVGRGC